MNKYYILIFSLFVFYGCNANGNKNIVFQSKNGQYEDTIINFRKFPNELKLHFNEYLKTNINTVRGILITDSSIILTDDDGLQDGYFFWEYSKSSKNVIGKYIKGGTKKGMTLGPLCFGLTKDNKLFIRDISLRKIILANLDKKLFQDTLETEEFSANEFNYSEVVLDEKRSLRSSILDTSKYLVNLIDITTDTVITKFGILNEPPNNIPFGSWKHANMNFMYSKPDLSKVILACRYTDKITIYDLKTKKGISAIGPDNLEISFLPIKAGIRYMSQPTEQTYYTFRSGFTTNKYIYLLYYGKKNDSKNHIDGDIIFVYDWNGIPIKKLFLDRMIQGFAISSDDENIYAFDAENNIIVTSKIYR